MRTFFTEDQQNFELFLSLSTITVMKADVMTSERAN
jgi:hypothetical protein